MHEFSDEELVRLSLEGQVEAFEELVNRYKNRIYGFCLRILNNQKDAEDAAQETFIKVYKSLRTFKKERKFKPWLFKICVNTCYNIVRRRKAKISLDKIEEIKDEKSEEFTHLSGLELERALKKLSYEYKTVLLLYYWQGYNTTEIGKIMKLPKNTIKTRLQRARKYLKQILEDKR